MTSRDQLNRGLISSDVYGSQEGAIQTIKLIPPSTSTATNVRGARQDGAQENAPIPPSSLSTPSNQWGEKDKGAGTYNPSLGLHTLPLTYGPKCAYWFDDYGSTNGWMD